MLFGQSEDKKQIAAILNTRADLQNGILEKANEKELQELFERYKKACHDYIATLKNMMAISMVGAKLSDDEEVKKTASDNVHSISEFIKGMLSDVYCMEVRVVNATVRRDDYMADVRKQMGELKARQTLRREAEDLRTFVGEIHEQPGMHAHFDIEGKNRRQVQKETKSMVDNFQKLLKALALPFERSRIEARAALQKENQNKR